MKKLIALVAATVTLAVVGGTASADMKKVRIATEGAYPPFNFVDPRAAASTASTSTSAWRSATKMGRMRGRRPGLGRHHPGLLAKKYDFIIASMFITEERKQQVAFSDPYYIAAMTHVAPKDSGITEFTDEA